MIPSTSRRSIIHLDLDAFYASVEQLRRPELRGKPVIVGGGGEGHTARSVVSAASYEARTYGIRSAMPLSRALRLCPHATVLPVDFTAYRAASSEVFRLAHEVTPLVEPLSLDEAYLDVTATPGAPAEIAAALRARILAETSLHASFGVATSKTVAKIASDLRKPRGFVVVPPGEEPDFLAPMPLRALPGLGPASEAALVGLGLRTLGDLARHPLGLLERRLGRSAGQSLHMRAQGIDPSPVTPPAAPKSISREVTFDRDISDQAALRDNLRQLAADVAGSLRKSQLFARTVALKLRYEDFTTLTRQHTLDSPDDTDGAITAAALALLGTHAQARPVRLLGVGVHNLEAAAQLDLFAESSGSGRLRTLDARLDALRRRFGPKAVWRGGAAPALRDLDWRGEDLRELGAGDEE